MKTAAKASKDDDHKAVETCCNLLYQVSRILQSDKKKVAKKSSRNRAVGLVDLALSLTSSRGLGRLQESTTRLRNEPKATKDLSLQDYVDAEQVHSKTQLPPSIRSLLHTLARLVRFYYDQSYSAPDLLSILLASNLASEWNTCKQQLANADAGLQSVVSKVQRQLKGKKAKEALLYFVCEQMCRYPDLEGPSARIRRFFSDQYCLGNFVLALTKDHDYSILFFYSKNAKSR